MQLMPAARAGMSGSNDIHGASSPPMELNFEAMQKVIATVSTGSLHLLLCIQRGKKYPDIRPGQCPLPLVRIRGHDFFPLCPNGNTSPLSYVTAIFMFVLADIAGLPPQSLYIESCLASQEKTSISPLHVPHESVILSLTRHKKRRLAALTSSISPLLKCPLYRHMSTILYVLYQT